MKRDVDYVVQNGEVVIVDEFTGRLMVGRRYSDGLHQAIEAKEHVKVQRESKTLATITFQNYLPHVQQALRHDRHGQDGGGGIQAASIKLDVVQIPTNRPMIRKDMNDLVYRTQKGKFSQVIEEIERRHKTGQPVLVGTVSVEVSEAAVQDAAHARHRACRAEREVSCHARRKSSRRPVTSGAVTIATNMAGRGTDILLGGNPEFLARRAMQAEGL